MFTRGELRVGKDKQQSPFFTWDSVKSVEIASIPELPAPFDTIQVDGRGFKGKFMSVSYEWDSSGIAMGKGSLPKKPLDLSGDRFKSNVLRLPMPNLHNVGQDLEQLGI